MIVFFSLLVIMKGLHTSWGIFSGKITILNICDLSSLVLVRQSFIPYADVRAVFVFCRDMDSLAELTYTGSFRELTRL